MAELEEKGEPRDLGAIARGVARRMGLAAETDQWIHDYLAAEIATFANAFGNFPLTFDDRVGNAIRFRPDMGARDLVRLAETVSQTSAYMGARLLYFFSVQRLSEPPFPSIEVLAQEAGIDAERMRDAIRIASLLPPELLLKSGASWMKVEGLTHEMLVASSLRGRLPARLAEITTAS